MLNLSDNEIGNPGAEAIAVVLRLLRRLELFEIRNNKIKDKDTLEKLRDTAGFEVIF